MSLCIPLKIGEATTILDPATDEPITVIVTAIEDGGRVTIRVVASSDVKVAKVRDPEALPTLH